MNRLKLLAAVMLLATPIISACGEDPPAPPPTGMIDGLVSIEGQGIDGVAVTLSNGASSNTANGGMFGFDGVEAGSYTLTITDYPDDASFDRTSAAATIATGGETVSIKFAGTFIRTSSIMGTVTVENEGLGGVAVRIAGMSNSETHTDGNGQYAFTGLRAGTYTVEISGFDEDDVAFSSTSSAAVVAVGESKVVGFEGTYLRTAAISGQVSVEGNPLSGVTVSMQGRGEDRTATTNSAGQFNFSEVRSGDYSVGISGFDADEYGFEVISQSVTVAHGETANVPFEGIVLRSASIIGTVTVEGAGGIEDVMVTIQGPGGEQETTTNRAGQFNFTQLHAGDYSVGITGYNDDLYGFEVTTATVAVELKETATVPFEGIELRTAGIQGTVTVDGHPLSGVTVTISGGPRDEEHETVTNEAGYYMVDDLHAGDYAVVITNPDADEYGFEATTQSVSVGLRQTATVAFQGELLRTAGISGRVSVEGTGLDGVAVTLSGDADMTATTADGGQYAFAGLAEGKYTVAISGWDEAAYTFETTEASLDVADAAAVQNFDGLHTRTASVRGMLFLDEVDVDGRYTDGEPALEHAGIQLLLQGPGVNDVQSGMSNEDGSYAFENLKAGNYRVLVNMDAEGLVDSLAAHGFSFSGEVTGQMVSVEAATSAAVNFPFRIVLQTIYAGAVMGDADETGHAVAGVKLEMYPTAEDADNGTNGLGTATTDSTGRAKFEFPRAKDLGPGGNGTDRLVFVKIAGTGHDDLVVSRNAHIEIEYASTARSSMAPTAVRLLNRAINFQWWIKSDADAKDGNAFLGGWKVVIGSDTVATGADGRGSYSGTAALGEKATSITVMADTAQADSLTMREAWTQTAALTYTHNPLALPAANTATENDLGPVYITFETQSLVLGVYREADDVDGYTNYRSAYPRGDHRPHASVAREMAIELLERDDRNRLRRYTWDPHPTTGKDRKEGYSRVGSNGLVTFTGIPADAELTVRYHVGDNRVPVDYGYDEIEAFGDDVARFGSSVGGFGDLGGAGPEVRICSASEGTDDHSCATFGYQWTTGLLSGNVGDQSGHEVEVEPETGHGAIARDTKTGENGAYAITGLRDGEYAATASDQGDYTVNGAATLMGLAVYHDEFADEKNEDSADSAWVGKRARAGASWTTTRGGLSIMGYVASDNDENNLLRGDEAMAGVKVNLLTDVTFVKTGARAGQLSSSKTAATTETGANGLYSFSGLNNATKYWVQVVTDDVAGGYQSLSSKNPSLAGGTSGFSAQAYPALPIEGSYAKPAWSHTANSASNTSVTYTVGTGSAAQSATLRNFGLVYRDGTVSGQVNNLSGSSANIDVRITTATDSEAVWERATGRNGDFLVSDVLEGMYTAVIEDVGYAHPCVTAAGVPDDDARQDDPDNPGIETCIEAASSVTGTVEGRADYQSLGTLHVYNARMGADDLLETLVVTQTVGGVVDTLGTPGRSITQHVGGTTAVTGPEGTIAYATARVRVIPTSTDADATAQAMIGTTACPGNLCTLPYHATDGTTNTVGEAARGTTITVLVTAENGYNDHAYTFNLARTNPVDNVLERTEILKQDGSEAGGTGGSGETAGNPWQITTAAADSSAITLTFDLEEVATEAVCGQSVSVRVHGGAEQEAIADPEDDACEGEQYRLSAGTSGTVYEITVTSQDGVARKHYINLTLGA